jgi:bla regulator protein BlaR1
MHELAHVRRLDILAQSIAGWLCTLNWFNPVGWLGLAQMRKLRELACDDLVLASGGQPAEYADVLLQVAKTYRQKNLAVTVGMARSANVENRIMAILDRARSHVSVSEILASRVH